MALETLGVLREELKKHRIETRTELMPEPLVVMGHRGQLEEILINLIRNAIEAMDAIDNRTRVLQLSTQTRGRDAVVIAVEDTGPGIDPEKLDSIFDAFVTTKQQGMGLGLAICRLMIERHGGRLSALSGNKGGARFEIVLPLKSTTGSLAA
jgi:signal transduction histidine kinase